MLRAGQRGRGGALKQPPFSDDLQALGEDCFQVLDGKFIGHVYE